MDENGNDGGRTAMERLCRELMDRIERSAATSWCREHGYTVKGTNYVEDQRRARADILRRIEDARTEDDCADSYAAEALKELTGMHRGHTMCTRGEVDEMAAVAEGWKAEAAELDALCRVLNAESADEAVAAARALAEEHYELKELREAGRVMPEGMSWPRYADGEPVRVGDVLRTRGMMHGEYRVVGVSACGMASVVAEDVEDDDNIALLDPELMDRAPKAVGADGREVKVGETVWLAHEYREKAGDYSVKEDGGRLMPECGLRGVYPDGAAKVASVVEHCVRLDTSWDAWYPASWLTHERPDSWERLRDDALKTVSEYWGCGGWECHECPASVGGETPRQHYGTVGCFNAMHLDIVARAERLAGVRGDA